VKNKNCSDYYFLTLKTNKMRIPKQSKPVERSYSYKAQLNSAGLTQSDTCVSLRTANNRVCLRLPVVGNVCLPFPIPIPSGTLARGCFSICKKGVGPFKVPTGACLAVSIGGRQIVRKCFGFC
jgi:hypothetical protein